MISPTQPPPLTFPQTLRMKTPAEFDRAYARKRSVANGTLIVYACENGLPHSRLGCSVSRKVGGAIRRNRYKRLFREAFRLAQHELPSGLDFVVIPRPGPEPTQRIVSESLLQLARQAARKLADGKRVSPPVSPPSEKALPRTAPTPTAPPLPSGGRTPA